ncbi:MAG: DUF308 domain-containing protein [Erysipelotrichaceae bacterium]|nr:DUF308 domain-containing protein [Erysipelotrichaceae bacterium]
MLINLNIQSKTLKILSLILTVTGIIFILASKHIGSISICLAMIIILIFCVVNFKMTYTYLSLREKINHLIAALAAFAGLYKPESTMLILGIFLLYITLPIYVKSIKNKDFSDVINLIISGAGILFAVFCIFNSKAALHTIIIIIGIAFTILGCISLYQALTSKKDNTSNDDTDTSHFIIEDNTSS